ncbi:hypothetical protein VA599_21100 [Chromobacterium sp. TRC.1.1.SA]|uniref:Uncharacterized protein n=1 Tax=Chromobacterium indicum TaxID=3110228 RepID=A0ABV0CQ10_9NEIS
MLLLLEMRLSGKAAAERDVNGGSPVLAMPGATRMPNAWYFQFGDGAIQNSLGNRYFGGKHGFNALKYRFVL